MNTYNFDDLFLTRPPEPDLVIRVQETLYVNTPCEEFYVSDSDYEEIETYLNKLDKYRKKIGLNLNSNDTTDAPRIIVFQTPYGTTKILRESSRI